MRFWKDIPVTFDLPNLLQCLDLHAQTPTKFEGDNLDLEYSRVYGGQVLAQSIMALEKVADGKSLKSFVQHFPREGDVALPMTYDVTVHQAGRTFALLGVAASQANKLVSSASASLHLPEEGIERESEIDMSPGPQDSVPTDLTMVPWEVRVVDGTDLGTRESRPPRYRFWMRAELPYCPAAENSWVHQALLAHASDLTVIGTALLPVIGVSQNDTGTAFHTAVTSHSMWFHRPFRIDEWLLVDQESPIMSGGRSFGRGDVRTQDGQLVASFAQESMVRLLAPLP